MVCSPRSRGFVALVGGLLPSIVFSQPAFARAAADFSRLVEQQGQVVVNVAAIKPTPRNADAAARPTSDDASGLSLGSGLIISRNGYVLSCAHVVERATLIQVLLADRREFSARVIGSDRRSDIALLKIEANGLTPAISGDADKLRVGEPVLAIGSPFGFQSSASAGIVSGTQRSLPGEPYMAFIQTDVAINPGNSGGPLFNLRGEVVGINSQNFSRTGGFMGVSFAIPIDVATRIADELKRHGFVRRGWLGINVQEVSRDIAAAYDLYPPRGALVSDILVAGPAAQSPLRRGDIVLAYEGQAITNSAALAPRVGLSAPGALARMEIVRRGEGRKSIAVRVGELSEAPSAMPGSPPVVARMGLGLELTELDLAARDRLATERGVLVRRVHPGYALDAGLAAGDVLVEVDGQLVASVAESERLLARASEARPVLVRIRRGNSSSFVAVRGAGPAL